MWYYLKQLDHIYIYIYIYTQILYILYIYIYIYIYTQILKILYITSKLVFKEYLTSNIMKKIKFHAKGTIDVVFANTKVLHHLGEKSHNLNKLNNNVKK